MPRQRSRRDMARNLTDHQTLPEHWLSTSQLPQKDKSRIHQFGQKTLKGIFLGSVLRAGRGWSGDLMIADYEIVKESQTSEIYVKRFKSQEVFVERRVRISVCKRNSETSHRPRPSLTAEGNLEPEDDVEIEEGDKNSRKTKDLWSKSGIDIMKNHEYLQCV